MSISRQFGIESWHAWAPGLVEPAQWQAYFAAPGPLAADDKADVGFLPAMQRRRLSPLARAAFFVSQRCMADAPPCPVIYSSIYGETRRSDTILQDMARGEDMSPTAFGLSVHNAIAGQSSILFGNKQPIFAEAPSDQSYLTAFVDAIGLLAEGHESVLLVFYEEQAPAFFAPFCHSTDFTCALAIKIRRPVATGHSLQLDYTGGNEHDDTLPDLLCLIRFLALGQPQLDLGAWRLTRD
ncbi:MAG TPA: beta-ketoacyl synthase chain length factor [Pseudomonadales bacterium]